MTALRADENTPVGFGAGKTEVRSGDAGRPAAHLLPDHTDHDRTPRALLPAVRTSEWSVIITDEKRKVRLEEMFPWEIAAAMAGGLSATCLSGRSSGTGSMPPSASMR